MLVRFVVGQSHRDPLTTFVYALNILKYRENTMKETYSSTKTTRVPHNCFFFDV